MFSYKITYAHVGIAYIQHTTHNSPIYSKQYPLAQTQEIEVESQVREMPGLIMMMMISN